MFIFKICDKHEWLEAANAGFYLGSSDDLRDGFIHLSTAEQLGGTAAKHFTGQEDLLLIAFDADHMGDALRWEESRGGALFPHFYGRLETGAACWVRPLPLGPDGHGRSGGAHHDDDAGYRR